ncbi:proton myo-inositol cotransporter-like [Sycon ciliatum]|uniref:proton myo-inositol cotransporter-like n=1 Tax=Sycon ciliatum TaxID=27933 RepID=UPI0031F695B0
MERPSNTTAAASLDSDEEMPDALSSSSKQAEQGTSNRQEMTTFVYVLTFFAAIGGFLFGYDTGVVSGAMLKLAQDFDLATWQKELLVSITIAGAAVSSAAGGVLNDYLGRKPVLLGASLVFTAGAGLMAVSTHWIELLMGRLIVGIGIGFASMTVPMYISEAAPIHVRGSLITVNNMFITGGQFVASAVDGLLADVPHGWRYMLGIGGIPSLVQFVGFLFLPESPRYLVKRRKFGLARSVLQRIRGSNANIDEEFESIQEECLSSVVEDQGTFGTLVRMFRSGPVRRALIVGCLLQACQQLTGINTLMYYSASIIKMAGVEDDTKAIWLAAAVAAGNLVFTAVGVYLVERSGRRKLMLGSLAGVTLSLAVLGVGFLMARLQSPVALVDGSLPPSTCNTHSTCNWCVHDANCGYCYLKHGSHGVLNGTCQPVWSVNGTKATNRSSLWDSNYTDCNPSVACSPAFAGDTMHANSTVDSTEWAYDYCPTQYAWLIVLALILYIAMFAPGMGPMPWTINAELYPLWARSTGNSAATFVNWACNLVISMTFLSISETHVLGRAGAFWIYMIIAMISFVIFYRILPETKDRPLEEAEKLFAKPWFGAGCVEHGVEEHSPLMTVQA